MLVIVKTFLKKGPTLQSKFKWNAYVWEIKRTIEEALQ